MSPALTGGDKAVVAAFLAAAVWVFLWRYQNAQKVVHVLRDGLARRGHVARAYLRSWRRDPLPVVDQDRGIQDSIA